MYYKSIIWSLYLIVIAAFIILMILAAVIKIPTYREFPRESLSIHFEENDFVEYNILTVEIENTRLLTPVPWSGDLRVVLKSTDRTSQVISKEYDTFPCVSKKGKMCIVLDSDSIEFSEGKAIKDISTISFYYRTGEVNLLMLIFRSALIF